MPSIKEILAKEHEKKSGTVVLVEEGLFFKAYEESACRYLFAYKMTVPWVGNVFCNTIGESHMSHAYVFGY